MCAAVGHPGKLIDRRGTRINQLTCIADSGVRGAAGQVLWTWMCDCGNFVRRAYQDVLRQQSCGECYILHRVRETCRVARDAKAAQTEKIELFDICIDDPVRMPSGRPAVVRAIHGDGSVDVRYTDQLDDPGCTIKITLLTPRRRKKIQGATP